MLITYIHKTPQIRVKSNVQLLPSFLHIMGLGGLSRVTVDPNMKQGVDNNTDTKHAGNNPEAFEVFRSVVGGE